MALAFTGSLVVDIGADALSYVLAHLDESAYFPFALVCRAAREAVVAAAAAAGPKPQTVAEFAREMLARNKLRYEAMCWEPPTTQLQWHWDVVIDGADKRPLVTKTTFSSVVARVETLDWAASAAAGADPRQLAMAATSAVALNLDVLKRLHARFGIGAIHAYETIDAAARTGDVVALAWALEAGGRREARYACAAAAVHGRIDVLAWLRERGCPWDGTTCLKAAAAGHLHVLKWAYARGCPERAKLICPTAAAHGHLHVLVWARANGARRYKWGDASVAAAAGGHVHVLDWAAARGCPLLEERAWRVAADAARVNVLDWLLARVGPPPSPSTLYQRALDFDNQITADWLREHGGI